MQKTAWGLSASIDLHGCDPQKIKSPEKIRDFVRQLCDLIDMTRHGETMVERFGSGQLYGYSFFQFIETSSISGHFDEIANRAFIDIFSCKPFDPKMAGRFSSEFFQAEKAKIRPMERA